MKVVLIEDEKPAARRLSRMIEAEGYDQITQLHSVEEAVNYFGAQPEVDLVFLDIQLSDGLSFEIFDHVEVVAPIIFTTAYDEYALQAFKHNSIDYLLKPIAKDDLEFALKKFSDQHNQQREISQVLEQVSNKLMGKQQRFKKRWMIRIGNQLKLIATDEIALFYSENKVNYLQTFKGRSFDIDQSLDDLEKSLNPDSFFRISRSAIISVDNIEQIQAFSNSRLKVISDSQPDKELIVSRERVKSFKIWLEQ